MSCMGGFAPDTATRKGLPNARAMKLSALAPMTGQHRSMHAVTPCDSEANLAISFSDCSLSSLYWNPAMGRAGISSLSASGLSGCAPYTLVLLRYTSRRTPARRQASSVCVVPSTFTRRFASRSLPCRSSYARCTTVSIECSANSLGKGWDTSCRTNDTHSPKGELGVPHVYGEDTANGLTPRQTANQQRTNVPGGARHRNATKALTHPQLRRRSRTSGCLARGRRSPSLSCARPAPGMRYRPRW